MKSRNEILRDVSPCMLKAIAERVEELYHSKEPLSADILGKHCKLAHQLAELAPTEGLICELECMTGAHVTGWLLDLPFQLHSVGMTSEALQHQRFWSEVLERANFLGDRAIMLAEAGMEDEAYRQITELDIDFPNDLWVQIKIGDALYELNEFERTEKRYRKALSVSNNDYDRQGALERLAPIEESREFSVVETCAAHKQGHDKC